jgi:hypothetical protein
MPDASSRLLERLRLELPVMQAAMAGDPTNSEMAVGVARAGGLGSVGMHAPQSFFEEISRARAQAEGRPIAAGLLLPFTRRAHVEALIAARPDAGILTAGFAPDAVRRIRAAGIYVMHQVGSQAAASRALRDGADALIAQGVEAGGHVLGNERGATLLQQVLEVAGDAPVVLSGSIATHEDVARALEQGAAAAMAGSRYLLTHESAAHPAYKERILGAQRTLLTQLFGVGWTLKHAWCRTPRPRAGATSKAGSRRGSRSRNAASSVRSSRSRCCATRAALRAHRTPSRATRRRRSNAGKRTTRSKRRRCTPASRWHASTRSDTPTTSRASSAGRA